MDKYIGSRGSQLFDQPGKLLGMLMRKDKVRNVQCVLRGHEHATILMSQRTLLKRTPSP
jgi:hypothetical protein